MAFVDRHDAGRQLAARLRKYSSEHAVVLGLPRGGVPIAFEIAKSLNAPLDVFIVRKIGAPQNPEFAVGAVAEEGVALLDRQTTLQLGSIQIVYGNLLTRPPGMHKSSVSASEPADP